MIRSKRQQDTGSLVDLSRELTDAEHLTILKVYGLGAGPLEPDKTIRPPYDSLYLKLRYDRDFWRQA